jgi:hypothetical protein
MSLTPEQLKELNKINDVFARIEQLATSENLTVDELGEDYMTFGLATDHSTRLQMNKLAEERAQVLALQKAFSKQNAGLKQPKQ